MNYRLNRQGIELGVFSLEELRQRRQSGELTGAEYALPEGGTEWRPLDVILQQAEASPPKFIPGNKPANSSTPKWVWAVAVFGGCVFLTVAVAVVVGVFQFRKAIQRNQGLFQSSFQNRNTEDPVTEASKPAVPTPTTQTAADAQKRARAFRVRQWLDGYKERGQRNAPCDAEALEMLESWIAQNYGGSDETNLPPAATLADKLAAEPDCNDPLILTVTGVLAIDPHEKMRRLDRALAGFDKSGHRGYPKFYAAVEQAAEWNNNPAKVAELDRTALRYFGEMFKDGSLPTPEDLSEMGEILTSGWGERFFTRNQRSLYQSVPDKKPFQWLRLVLEGQFHINEAWRLRGNGYSGTVSQPGWQGFSSQLSSARECLTKAYELQPGLALAPCKMIEVSLGDSGIAEMRTWFDHTTAIQMDYYGAWHEMRWGLRPRWYGNEAAMLAFGATAVNTERFDTDVPRMLFDSVEDIESEAKLEPGQHLCGREDIWPLFQKMYEGYIAEPANQANHDGWRSTYATIAYIAGHYDVARAQLEAVHWNPWTNNFTGYGLDLSLMPLEVAARTGPASNAVDRAESARANGDEKKALQIYQDLGRTNTDARTAEFIRIRLASLGVEQKLGDGAWVDFLPTGAKDPNWEFVDTVVQSSTNGVLEIESGPDGHFLYSHVDFATGFEVRGEFEIVEATSKEFQAGVIMGLLERDGRNWLGFRIRRSNSEGDVASFTRGWTRTGTTKPVTLNDGRNSFSFRLEKGLASATVNDTVVFQKAPLPARISVPEGEFHLGLGAHGYQNETLVRYRNVQVRRL